MLELAVGLLVTAGLAPLVRSVMVRTGVLDVPNHRSSHAVAVPRGGGLACLGGVLVACVVAEGRGIAVPWVGVAAAVALAVVGFVDDRGDLPPLLRLGAQVCVGVALGWWVGGWPLALIGAAATPVCVNVVNFMDGINGITSVTLTVWGVTAAVLGHHEHLVALQLVGAAAAGAALGFLPWNAPVARLFLGDSGSYLFGALVALGLLLAWDGGAPVAIAAAPLAIYLIDTGSTLLSRVRRGEPVLEAHRSHIYQRLTSGPGAIAHLAVALYSAGLAAVVTVAWARLPWVGAVLVTAGVGAVYLATPRVTEQFAHVGRARPGVDP